MKLSRLEIFGFKSFAKKLDLKLLGGITAVVGPNGCGKTNVVDAIRWVLGEQRPTQIRLDKMEDVIFKGSASRRQLGIAEVSLTIENVSGILPVDLPEITITRRLFRSGESEYLVNRKACRLADINDIFMDTGMGSDSYSVFEQAMINSILSDKTEDRRHIFEEAAGITKYKSRRRSALNTLMSIDGDLDRLGDITAELERRVDLLKRQASKAARYRRLKSELKSKTITLGSFEIEKQKRKTVEVSSALASVQSAIESNRAKTGTVSAEIERLSTDTVTVEKQLAELAGQYESNTRAMSEKESESARLEARLESLGEMIARAHENARRNSASLEKLAEEHGKCGEELNLVEKRFTEIDTQYTAQAEEFKTFNSRVIEKADDHNKLGQEYTHIEREITSKKFELTNISLQREGNETRLREITNRLDKLNESVQNINEERRGFQEQKLSLSEKKDTISKRLSGLKQKFSDRTNELEDTGKQLLQARERRISLKAETDFLNEVIKTFKGYSDGVKKAVNSKELDGHVQGVFADLISADEKYVPAVEAALADSLRHIVVDTREAAVEGVKFLSESAQGRAVFVPINTKSPANPDIPKEKGVLGAAYEFIRTDDRFNPVVRNYLGNVVIVEALETAVNLHDRFPQYSFVTLHGELVGPHGEIHGGQVGNDYQKSSIGRLEKLKQLGDLLLQAESETEQLEHQRAGLLNEIDSIRTDIESTEQEFGIVGGKLAEISSQEAGVAARHEAAVDAIERLRSESSKLKTLFQESETRANKLDEDIRKSLGVFSGLEEKLGISSREIDELNNELESIRTEMNRFEIERAALREKKTALTRELDTISERRESLAYSSRRTMKEIEDAENESLGIGEKRKRIAGELDRMAQEHTGLEDRKVSAGKQYAELRSYRSEKERKLEEFRNELVELSKKESSLTLEKDEASMIMKNIIQRIADEYFISPDEIPQASDDPEFEAENEKLLLEDLRRKVFNIGDVNLAAEADYEEEKKRLDYLTGERQDLIDAREGLIEAISRINSIAKDRFLNTFEKIRTNFQLTFRKFFDGGICDLIIPEDDDPLEANIIITARPPGKNVRSISLLSSGERALTAISLLFAIYMVKPSPFCILDEVDAPLDDANIDRFLRVIKEFSKKTQFVMVTHNKKTMAAADNLYGITMVEPGLSSLVSVRLSEVETYKDISEISANEDEQVGDETMRV